MSDEVMQSVPKYGWITTIADRIIEGFDNALTNPDPSMHVVCFQVSSLLSMANAYQTLDQVWVLIGAMVMNERQCQVRLERHPLDRNVARVVVDGRLEDHERIRGGMAYLETNKLALAALQVRRETPMPTSHGADAPDHE
jgi:hypothetical protein